MLNVTIQNDGKIKFQSECSSTKEMRSNVNLIFKSLYIKTLKYDDKSL